MYMYINLKILCMYNYVVYVLFKLIKYMPLSMLPLFLFPLQLLKFCRLKTLNLSHNTDIAIDPKDLEHLR